MSCCDSTADNIITIVQGDTIQFPVQLMSDEGELFDLTGVDILEMFPLADGTVLSQEVPSGDVTSAVAGKLILRLTSAQTMLLKPRSRQTFQLKLTQNAGLTDEIVTIVDFLELMTVLPSL